MKLNFIFVPNEKQIRDKKKLDHIKKKLKKNHAWLLLLQKWDPEDCHQQPLAKLKPVHMIYGVYSGELDQ